MPKAPPSNTLEPSARYNRGRRADYVHWWQITTRWMDNDVYAHVNNVVYYSFFDTAVNGTLIKKGLLKPDTSDVIGLVVETSCRYAASLAFPDDVDAGIRVGRLGNSSVRYEVGLFRAGEEEAAADGHFVHVYVDRHTRKPTKLPAELRAFLETLQLKGDR